jgi:hypothetical protein
VAIRFWLFGARFRGNGGLAIILPAKAGIRFGVFLVRLEVLR